jgi:hypothetical protein
MSQEGGATIGGLVEDMARMYPKSIKEAGLEAEVQKDCWHFQRDGGKALRDLERAAFRLTAKLSSWNINCSKSGTTLFLWKSIFRR